MTAFNTACRSAWRCSLFFSRSRSHFSKSFSCIVEFAGCAACSWAFNLSLSTLMGLGRKGDVRIWNFACPRETNVTKQQPGIGSADLTGFSSPPSAPITPQSKPQAHIRKDTRKREIADTFSYILYIMFVILGFVISVRPSRGQGSIHTSTNRSASICTVVDLLILVAPQSAFDDSAIGTQHLPPFSVTLVEMKTEV